MANEENKASSVEMLGKAVEGEVDVAALKEEIAKLKSEKAEMESRIQRLINDRDQYSKWWGEANTEKEQLRAVVKAIVAYAKLA